MKKTFVVFLMLMVMGCGQQTKTNELPQTQNQIEQKVNEGEPYDPSLDEKKEAGIIAKAGEKIAELADTGGNFLSEHWKPVAIVTTFLLVSVLLDYKYDLHGTVWEYIKKGGGKIKDVYEWVIEKIRKTPPETKAPETAKPKETERKFPTFESSFTSDYEAFPPSEAESAALPKGKKKMKKDDTE